MRSRDTYTKLPSEIIYFLVYHHNKRPSDLYPFFAVPPRFPEEKEKVRLQLRYLRDVKKKSPTTFDQLLIDSILFLTQTPLASFRYLNSTKLSETMSSLKNLRSKAARASLSFVDDDDDDDSVCKDISNKTNKKKDTATVPTKAKSSKTGPTDITITTFLKEERHSQGLMTVEYVGIRYRPKSLIDLFQKSIKQNASRDGWSLDIVIPKYDGELKQDIQQAAADTDAEEVLNPILDKMAKNVGVEYVKALLMQITNTVDKGHPDETITVQLPKQVIPESLVVHKLPVDVTAATGKYDRNNNPKTYTYKIVEFVYIFKVANSEKFIKRYAAANEDDLADEFDNLIVDDGL